MTLTLFVSLLSVTRFFSANLLLLKPMSLFALARIALVDL